MAEKQFSIKLDSAPAETVGQSTIDFLKQKQMLHRYEVKEVEPTPAKPKELTAAATEVAEAATPKKPKPGSAEAAV